MSDACYLAKKTLVTGSLGVFDASLTTIRAHDRNAKGEANPTYRCLFPEPPPDGTVPTCAEAGVLGALAGVLGSMMALEAIRDIVGFGESLVGRLLMIDARSMRFETLNYARDPSNPLNGDKPTIKDLSGHALRGGLRFRGCLRPLAHRLNALEALGRPFAGRCRRIQRRPWRPPAEQPRAASTA